MPRSLSAARRIVSHFIHHAAFTDVSQNRVMLEGYNVKLFLCHPAGALGFLLFDFTNRVGSGGAAVLPHHPAYLRTRRFPITFTRSFYGLKIVTL
ncbi:MAG: hypothetical protein ABR980_11445, partial [Ignavibacteriaceae bacterium]